MKKTSVGFNPTLLNKFITEGTAADKVTALTLSIKESPNYPLSCLDKLLEICEGANRKIKYEALDTMKVVLKIVFQKEDLQKIVYFNHNLKSEIGNDKEKLVEVSDENLIYYYKCHTLRTYGERFLHVTYNILTN